MDIYFLIISKYISVSSYRYIVYWIYPQPLTQFPSFNPSFTPLDNFTYFHLIYIHMILCDYVKSRNGWKHVIFVWDKPNLINMIDSSWIHFPENNETSFFFMDKKICCWTPRIFFPKHSCYEYFCVNIDVQVYPWYVDLGLLGKYSGVI